MATKQFLSYRYKTGLPLYINDLRINGNSESELIDRQKNSISLYGDASEGKIKLDISTEIPEDWLNLVPGTEADNPQWQIIAKLNCRSTKYREGVNLISGANKFSWKGEVTFNTDDLDNTAKLKLYLVRSEPASSGNGTAKYAKIRIGESESWAIHLSPPSAPLGEHLKIIWHEFSKHPMLGKYEQSVYYVDLDNSPPEVYLNLEVEQLQSLLHSKHKSGPRAYMRDQLVDSMVINIWTSLFIKSAENCDGDDGPNLEWQQMVLKSISQLLYPGDKPEESYKKILLEIDRRRTISSFLPEIIPVLQTFNPAKVRFKQNLEKLIQTLFK